MGFAGRKTYTLEEARRRMEGFCAYRERCHQEVVARLESMGMIPEAIDSIVVHLIQEGFLNEARFAKAFSRGKLLQKGWGKTRIRRELKLREISDYLIQKALGEILPEEADDVFSALSEKRWEQLSGEGDRQKKLRKFSDYLLYRGWEFDKIMDKVRELEKES
ncbi:MAG: RecX family transcriptional regulator [Bacteroidetes bacterium]|jgi:regulatory protein|nr:MAG: RecX family transcriptional regulator [Bacteroidota bacterium]UCE69151.1 MAG: RecX family transcriptional regulator [Flavobacteriaceae bacterium]